MSLAAAKAYASATYTANESSGTRVDASGFGNDLTDHNTVGSGTGVMGNAAVFVKANNEYLDCASSSSLQFGNGDATIVLWFSLAAGNGNELIGRVMPDNSLAEWNLRVSRPADNRIEFDIWDQFYSSDTVLLNTAALGTSWHLLCATYTASTNEMTLSVDAGTRATGTQTLQEGFNITSSRLYLGTNLDGGGAYDGSIDEVVLLKGYAFSTADEAELWNSGAGVPFALWAPPTVSFPKNVIHSQAIQRASFW